ncbi:MAG TPA: MscL family protein, partial [Burkholderiales bacterium]|nr:MscL family protein [Burkholderiales bacterium]
MLTGFKKFILKGNVIDLAVAVVIGAAFSAVVDALVKSVMMPLISLLVGQ